MSGYSNVGNRGVYEAGDQRNVSEAERKAQESDPYNEGKENSHSNLDSSKNSRTKKRKDLTLTNIRRGWAIHRQPTSCWGEEVRAWWRSWDCPIKEGPYPACKSNRDRVVTSNANITRQARAHGNEPSKGAKVDAELQAEEEEELKRKGKA